MLRIQSSDICWVETKQCSRMLVPKQIPICTKKRIPPSVRHSLHIRHTVLHMHTHPDAFQFVDARSLLIAHSFTHARTAPQPKPKSISRLDTPPPNLQCMCMVSWYQSKQFFSVLGLLRSYTPVRSWLQNRKHWISVCLAEPGHKSVSPHLVVLPFFPAC
jgi:hypothetical protein